MKSFDDIIKKLKLFWQYPVITEKTVYEQQYNNEHYYGIPWATLIDKRNDKRYNMTIIINILKSVIPKQNYITCCQHISFRNLIPIFKTLNITTVYTPHKVKGEDEISGIKIMACPLYAVNIEDPSRNNDFLNINYSDYPRDLLYSFIGGFQVGYLTDIRQKLFDMKHPSNTVIKNSGIWHFDKDVYFGEQGIEGKLNEDETHKLKTKIYNEALLRSNFSLSPSGSGPNSIRLWESLACGSIPVLLADTLDLPEHELWYDAIVKVKERDSGKVPEILSAIPEARVREMRKNCLKIYQDFKENFLNINVKLNMVMFTNCHGEKYINMFKRDTNIDDMFNINYIVSYQQLDNFNVFKNDFEHADVLIINRIKSYTDYTIQNLKTILKKNVLLIIIPFVRFDGYWMPEPYKTLTKIGENAVSFFPNILINQVDSYLNTSYDKIDFINYYNNCLLKLKRIESESDIKFYDFFIKNHTKYPMFRDNYHPTLNMLEYIGSEIMIKINDKFNITYKGNNVKLLEDTKEYGHYTPITNMVKDLLDIQYNLDHIFICSRKEYLSKIINYEKTGSHIKDLDDMKAKLWNDINNYANK